MLLVYQNASAILGYVSGQGCPTTVKNNHLVISFEGLGNMGVNQRAISNRFQSLGYTPANYPHIGYGSAAQCARKWQQKYPNLKISITGHSCGGSAAIETARILGKSGIRVASVMTIDPACIVRPLYRYAKPDNVDQLINFTGGVGFPVRGALNCNGGSNHIGMPNHPRVQTLARTMLQGYKLNNCDGQFDLPPPTVLQQNPPPEYAGTGNAESPTEGEAPPVEYAAPTHQVAPASDPKYGNATPEQIAIMKKYQLVHKNPNQPAKGCKNPVGCTWLKVSLEAKHQPAPGER